MSGVTLLLTTIAAVSVALVWRALAILALGWWESRRRHTHSVLFVPKHLASFDHEVEDQFVSELMASLTRPVDPDAPNRGCMGEDGVIMWRAGSGR